MAKTKKTAKSDTEVSIERRLANQRRGAEERRQSSVEVGKEKRISQRRSVTRRRQIDPTTCERDYTGEEIEFMQAMDAYKRSSGRMFPTCSEVLEVIRALGYEKQCSDSPPPDVAVELTEETDAEFVAETDVKLNAELDTELDTDTCLDKVSVD